MNLFSEVPGGLSPGLHVAKLNTTFESWRAQARDFILRGVLPQEISWRRAGDESTEVFPEFQTPSPSLKSPDALGVPAFTSRVQSLSSGHGLSNRFRVPADFLERANYVFAFRADDTPALLYRILWRVLHEEPHLLKISIDDDVIEFESRYRQVRRDLHKMHAFVRFREVQEIENGETIERFIAWHAPDHLIMRFAAPWFKDRFNGMHWSILTQDECAHWNQKELTYSPGVPRSMAPKKDEVEDLWKTYYKSIFNPARIKWNAMLKEFPVRHWKTMPETEVISELMRTSPERLQKFYRDQVVSAEQWLPSEKEAPLTLARLREALPQCQACGICERATQPVMGEGPLDAEIALVGEQPGEEEDRAGRPFLGPAGQLLNEALEIVGLPRDSLYITNAVKAFKWTDQEGYGRIHRGSSPQEIAACNPWLKKELQIVMPKKIVCLGRSAAQAILGKSILMRESRGKFYETAYGSKALIVPHPSFILRTRDRQEQQMEFQRFVEELRMIKNGVSAA